MPLADISVLLLTIVAAAYLQTVTGFAFGIVMIAGIAFTDTISITDATIVISCLSLTNAVQVLRTEYRQISWQLLRPVLTTALPLTYVGMICLTWLDGQSVDALKAIAGLTIVSSALLLLNLGSRQHDFSAKPAFWFYGALAGLMGGLFAMPGPPLVFHFLRQPLNPISVRTTLVAIFTSIVILRLASISIATGIPAKPLLISASAVPFVILVTWFARAYPPAISPVRSRQMICGLLLLSGLALMVPFAAKHFPML